MPSSTSIRRHFAGIETMMPITGESRLRRRALEAACVVSLLFATCVAVAPLGAEPLVARPFVHAPALAADAAPATPLAPPRRGVVRERAAAVQAEALVRGDGSSAVGVGQRIELSLFDDAAFSMTVKDVTRHATGGHTWSGPLDGDLGYAVLAQQDGTVIGHVVMPGAVYRIGQAGDGRAVIEELDQSVLRHEAPPLAPTRLSGDAAMTLGGESFDVAADSASQIDVMVVYTKAARNAVGGTTGILAEVNQAIASANQAYANNGMVQRVRLVFTSEVPQVEDVNGNIDNDVDTLQANPVVGWLRDASRADLVSMLIFKPSSLFCGVAYLMDVNSSVFAPFAYSVVDRDCISGLTFPHELGHNMGADHDTANTTGPTLFPYSHGWGDAVGLFRTIMAYQNAGGCGPACARLPFFSTPGQMFNGRPIGNAATADNERTLSETANTVANFRQALASPLTLTTSANKTFFVTGDTMLLSVGISNPGVPGVTVDAYLGLMSLDGTALFFTGLPVTPGGSVPGDIRTVASYRPLATGVPLDSPVVGTLSNFIAYQRKASDPAADLVLFFLLVKPGSLADGFINPADVVAVSLTPFTFQ
jgi:peptidyl-Asp metalloendopeptidase